MKIKLFLLLAVFILKSLSLCAQEVFVPNSKGSIDPLTRALTTGTKTGNGFFAFYGKKITSSLVLEGKNSNVILPSTSAVFYVFMQKNLPVQAWKLIPLKTKKNTRELPYMKTGLYSGTSTDLNDIQLMPTKLSDEVYELRPVGDLKNGEYALAYIENGVPSLIYDFRIESAIPPYPTVKKDVVLAEFYGDNNSSSNTTNNNSNPIIRWYFDSDPRGARIFYRVISNVPNDVKNTNESYLTTTPLEETKALNIPGLTYENASDVVIEIKMTKRGYEEQIKRYNARQVLDQQEISGFFELVEK